MTASDASGGELLAAWRSTDRARAHRGTSATEEQLFAAAERLLRQSPLDDLSVEQLLAEAGVSRRTFYVYFSSKYAVVGALIVKVLEDVYGEGGAMLLEQIDQEPAEVLGRLAERTCDLWLRHGPLMSAAQEHLRTEPELSELWLRLIGLFTDVFARYIDGARKAGRLPEGEDSRVLAATMVWASERCLYVAGLGLDPHLGSVEAATQPILSMWLACLGAGR